VTRRIITLARRAAAILAECNYAQRRAAAWRMAADTYVPTGDKAPDNYAEFLFRTSGGLLHEPAARHRADGHLVG
jgi:hypothetical protein